jgi:hypothetical protein
VPRLPAHGRLEPLVEGRAIDQPGQRIPERPLGQLPLEPPLLGQVAQGQHEAGDRRIGAKIPAGDLDLGRWIPVTPDDPVTMADGVRAAPGGQRRVGNARPDRVEEPEGIGAISRIEEVYQGKTGQPAVTHERGRRRCREADAIVLIEDEDDIGALLDQGAEVRLPVVSQQLVVEHSALHSQPCLCRQRSESWPGMLQ